MNIICTICARGGSKGVRNKNIRELAGKPLIAWTIEQALNWGKALHVIVSTDSQEIAETAKKFGADVPFMRPAELAADTSGKLPVIQHAVKYMEKKENIRYDIVLDLDPTSPLRYVEDIENAFKVFQSNPLAKNLYSVCIARKSPYFNMVEVNNGYSYLSKCVQPPVLRRQDAPKVYEMNASIYFFRRDFLLTTDSIHSDKTIIYEMPVERSIDIDCLVDFELVELLMKKRISEEKDSGEL